MSFSIPLKNCLQYEEDEVGKRAKWFSITEEDVNIPFSMVITFEAFDEFVKYNQLGPELEWFRNAQKIEDKIKSFERLSVAIRNAQFPEYVVESLSEVFELVSLDTEKLSNLSAKDGVKGLMNLTRSVNFDESSNSTPETYTTKETFKQFIETIKKVYLSTFTPGTLMGEDPKVAVIVSRVPTTKTIVDVSCSVSDNFLYVKTYHGFPDDNNKVQKDEFKVALEFLKIESQKIVTQKNVVVFDFKENKYELTELTKESSSQNLPDQTILEVCRLTKTILRKTKKNEVVARFSVNDNKINCISFKMGEEIAQKEVDFEDGIIESQKDPLLNPVEEKIYKFDVVSNDEEFLNLVLALKEFLNKYENRNLKSAIEILNRALEDPDKDSIKQAMEICKTLITNFE